jgi:hypothetical protein
VKNKKKKTYLNDVFYIYDVSENRQITPTTFQSVGDFVRKEQQLTVQLESEQFWSSLENTDGQFRR